MSITNTSCAVPPAGWQCSRPTGHEGPCAATPIVVLTDARLLEMEQQWLGFKAGVYADEQGQEWFELNTGDLIAEVRRLRAELAK